jgi:calcineurin-like phosphoesterase family protein
MELNEVIQIESLKRVECKPGDVLVLMTDLIIHPSNHQDFRDVFKAALPGTKLLILDHGMKLAVIDRQTFNEVLNGTD